MSDIVIDKYSTEDKAHEDVGRLRAALENLVDALPRCQKQSCSRPATCECGNPYDLVYACAEHVEELNARVHLPKVFPLSWAPQLVAALELLAKSAKDEYVAAHAEMVAAIVGRDLPEGVKLSFNTGPKDGTIRPTPETRVEARVHCKCGTTFVALLSEAEAKAVAADHPLDRPFEIDGCTTCNPPKYGVYKRKTPDPGGGT